jgi:hypothetical protein
VPPPRTPRPPKPAAGRPPLSHSARQRLARATAAEALVAQRFGYTVVSLALHSTPAHPGHLRLDGALRPEHAAIAHAAGVLAADHAPARSVATNRRVNSRECELALHQVSADAIDCASRLLVAYRG